MPPVVAWMFGAIGAAVVAKLLAVVARKANEDLERVRDQQAAQGIGVEKLERDPATGTYRPRKS